MTSHAQVHCFSHGKVQLSEVQYNTQLKEKGYWKRPLCGQESRFDHDDFEQRRTNSPSSLNEIN